MPTSVPGRIKNGKLGFGVTPTSKPNLFTELWAEGSLINPVVGLRLNPINPRMTVGALDAADFDGNINWVEITSANSSIDGLLSVIKIDGIRGYNGSFINFGNTLTAEIAESRKNYSLKSYYVKPGSSTDSRFIGLPPNDLWMNTDYTGPITAIRHNVANSESEVAYQCNRTSELPWVALTVTINGVDYQMESADNMIQNTWLNEPLGYCNVAVGNTTEGAAANVRLGLPFLRSVYL